MPDDPARTETFGRFHDVINKSKKEEVNMSLRAYKLQAARFAKQLGYTNIDSEIIDRIKSATSESEVTRIMSTARHRMTAEGR